MTCPRGYTTYFVLNKLFNGEEGTYATTTGVGQQQPDGWYFITLDGKMDDGQGPFESREAAERAALEEARIQLTNELGSLFEDFLDNAKKAAYEIGLIDATEIANDVKTALERYDDTMIIDCLTN